MTTTREKVESCGSDLRPTFNNLSFHSIEGDLESV